MNADETKYYLLVSEALLHSMQGAEYRSGKDVMGPWREIADLLASNSRQEWPNLLKALYNATTTVLWPGATLTEVEIERVAALHLRDQHEARGRKVPMANSVGEARDERDVEIAQLIRRCINSEGEDAGRRGELNSPHFIGIIEGMRRILAYVDPEPWK